MRKIAVLIMALSLITGMLAFASGSSDSSGTSTAASAGSATLGPGPMREGGFWATPQDYTAATGNTLPAYNEAPMLADMVAKGELPAVADRLPDQPMVVQPLNAIGRYGGTLTTTVIDAQDFWGFQSYSQLETLIERGWEDITRALMPNIVIDWDLNATATEFSMTLRKGHKWSNGDDFTADDFLFWYEDVLQNEELTPSISVTWKPGGELLKVETEGDTVVTMKMAGPWPGAIYAFSEKAGYGIQCRGFYPSDYAKQFHIKYNAKAGDDAKKAGFDEWYQLFRNKVAFNDDRASEGLPVLSPWTPDSLGIDHVVMGRNAYYFKVDTAGNQLPYIDGTKGFAVGTMEMVAGKVLDGTVDVGAGAYGGGVNVDKLPVLMKNAAKNNYNVSVAKVGVDPYATEATILPNHTYDDPIIKELFGNPKFMQALSHAINRDEINQLVFQGLAEPTLAATQETSPYYVEEYAKKYSDYDPEKVKNLLTEIGLKQNSAGYWLRPDGKELEMIITTHTYAVHGPISELIADHWDSAGIKTVIDATAGGEMWRKFGANQNMISLWRIDECDYARVRQSRQWWAGTHFWGLEWRQWVNSMGEQGTEPPAEVQEFVEIWTKIPVEPDEDEVIRLGRRAMELLSKNLWFIGVISPPPDVRFARKTLGNIDLDNIPPLQAAYGDVATWFFME